MEILTFLFIGLIAGWIASVFMKGHSMGIVVDIVVGVIGAFIGGYVFSIHGFTSYGFWGAVGTATIGAILLLAVLRLVSGPYGRAGSLKG